MACNFDCDSDGVEEARAVQQMQVPTCTPQWLPLPCNLLAIAKKRRREKEDVGVPRVLTGAARMICCCCCGAACRCWLAFGSLRPACCLKEPRNGVLKFKAEKQF